MTAMRWLRLPGVAMILMLATMGVSLQLGAWVSIVPAGAEGGNICA
jgi:hypothetical protein